MTTSPAIVKAVAQAAAYVDMHFRHTHHEFRDALAKGYAMALLSEEDQAVYREVVHGPWTDAAPTPATCPRVGAKP